MLYPSAGGLPGSMRGRRGVSYEWESPETPGRAKRTRRRALHAWLSQPLFLSGLLLGLGLACTPQLLWRSRGSSEVGAPSSGEHSPPRIPHASPPVAPDAFHAIVVPAGGQSESGPPPHVSARLKEAARLYKAAKPPKPYVITTAWGTPHKPCPRDAAGFERHEAADNALFLIEHGVPPEAILEESASLETVGNALFTRLLHTEPRGLRRLAVINNRFHMPRTRAVFDHVFQVQPASTETSPEADYKLTYFEVDDHLPADVLAARLAKEAVALPRFASGGEWRRKTRTLSELHAWTWGENTAYASKRLLVDRAPTDPELLKSY